MACMRACSRLLGLVGGLRLPLGCLRGQLGTGCQRGAPGLLYRPAAGRMLSEMFVREPQLVFVGDWGYLGEASGLDNVVLSFEMEICRFNLRSH